MDAVFSRPMPDWTDRSAVAAFAADRANSSIFCRSRPQPSSGAIMGT
ncbi:MAG: hypothetical protein WAK82_16330 [Streptosporangiaceae bacterium]